MRLEQYISEVSYVGNIGFAEMVQFYRIASKDQIRNMEVAIKMNDWKSFKSIIKKVLGINLL